MHSAGKMSTCFGPLAVQPGERVLSICSAGDNSFAFCLDKASEVVCIDLSQPQLALAGAQVARSSRAFDRVDC